MNLPVLDITDANEEFGKLKKKSDLLYDRFMAVAMDYQHYIDNSWGQKEIYVLRDNVQYRLFSAQFHIEILLTHHVSLQHRFNEMLKTDPQKILGDYWPMNPYFNYAEKEVSSIFDSFLYHVVSIFDYMGTLTNYICGPKQTKYGTLTWTKMASSTRDPQNHFGKKAIASVVNQQHRKFVEKLYKYRSFLIHEKADFNRYAFIITLGGESEDKVKPRFIAAQKLIKHFPALKELAETNYMTTKYVAFWILNAAFDSITELLFGLKKEMESNPVAPFPTIATYNKETMTMQPISIDYWHEGE